MVDKPHEASPGGGRPPPLTSAASSLTIGRCAAGSLLCLVASPLRCWLVAALLPGCLALLPRYLPCCLALLAPRSLASRCCLAVLAVRCWLRARWLRAVASRCWLRAAASRRCLRAVTCASLPARCCLVASRSCSAAACAALALRCCLRAPGSALLPARCWLRAVGSAPLATSLPAALPLAAGRRRLGSGWLGAWAAMEFAVMELPRCRRCANGGRMARGRGRQRDEVGRGTRWPWHRRRHDAAAAELPPRRRVTLARGGHGSRAAMGLLPLWSCRDAGGGPTEMGGHGDVAATRPPPSLRRWRGLLRGGRCRAGPVLSRGRRRRLGEAARSSGSSRCRWASTLAASHS